MNSKNKEFANSDNISGTSRKFSKNINSIRAISILFIVLSHCQNININIELNFIIFFYIATVPVYMLVFLSGLLLTINLSLENRNNNHWNSWYKKRIIRIYPSFSLVTFFALFYRFLINKRKFSFNVIFIHLSGMHAFPFNPDYKLILSAHWFITLILTCYMIFPILYVLLIRNFKFFTFLGIFFYCLFLTFYVPIFNFFCEIFMIIFQKTLIEDLYNALMPRYFVFFLGICLGILINRKYNSNISFFLNRKITLLAFFSILIINVIANIMLITLTFDNFLKSLVYYTCYPVLAIFYVLLLFQIFNKTLKLNKILDLPGRESYEIFLIHQIPLYICLMIQTKLELSYFYFIIIILGCIVLAYPFNLVGTIIKCNNRFHDIVVLGSLTLLIYAFISYTIFLLNLYDINNFFAITLYFSIFIITFLFYFFVSLSSKN
ncbi:MAG: acyltransferase family protein [Promethearchaeota archaeon]